MKIKSPESFKPFVICYWFIGSALWLIMASLWELKVHKHPRGGYSRPAAYQKRTVPNMRGAYQCCQLGGVPARAPLRLPSAWAGMRWRDQPVHSDWPVRLMKRISFLWQVLLMIQSRSDFTSQWHFMYFTSNIKGKEAVGVVMHRHRDPWSSGSKVSARKLRGNPGC